MSDPGPLQYFLSIEVSLHLRVSTCPKQIIYMIFLIKLLLLISRLPCSLSIKSLLYITTGQGLVVLSIKKKKQWASWGSHMLLLSCWEVLLFGCHSSWHFHVQFLFWVILFFVTLTSTITILFVFCVIFVRLSLVVFAFLALALYSFRLISDATGLAIPMIVVLC